MKFAVGLLLLGGCDFLFQIDHVPLQIDARTATADTTDTSDVNDAVQSTMFATEVDAGGSHTCVRAGSQMRCFGAGAHGRLGYGNSNNIGDDEYPRTAPFIDVGDPVMQVATGEAHTCVVTTGGGVRCWGDAANARLGYQSSGDIGDTETPSSVGLVSVGMTVESVAVGSQHTCALGNMKVRCWGSSVFGQLGYSNVNTIGDNETPASASDVNIGEDVTQIAAGSLHTCAVTVSGNVYCWGNGGSGRLGMNSTLNIGDDEIPSSNGGVPVGGEVIQVVAGAFHTCVLFTDFSVRCWGSNANGQLGTADGAASVYGDNEVASAAPIVDVGGPVKQLAAGDFHTCALLSTGAVRCWGQNTYGQLGYGNSSTIGDDESPSAVGDVSVGGIVDEITAGGSHTCARMATGGVRCWGRGELGRLGYGNTVPVGDDETPSTAGDVPVL